MALGERIKEGLTGLLKGLLYPGLAVRESAEAAALRSMYDSSNAGNMQPGCWYSLHSSGSGIRTAFRWVCYCGQSYDLPGQSEAFRDYNCQNPGCKRPFDFAGWTGIRLSRNKAERAAMLTRLARVGIIESDYPGGEWLIPTKYELAWSLLRKMPSLSRLDGQGGPRIIDTWNDSVGGVEYERSTPSFL